MGPGRLDAEERGLDHALLPRPRNEMVKQVEGRARSTVGRAYRVLRDSLEFID